MIIELPSQKRRDFFHPIPMSVLEQIELVQQLSEEHPEFQEQIAASLMSLLMDLRKAANCPPGEMPPVEFEKLAAWAWIEERLDGVPSFTAASDLARHYAQELGIPISRDTLRRLDLVIAWFDCHLDQIINASL
jgi:hypothetical protein